MATRQFCTFMIEDCCFGLEVSVVQEVLKYQEIADVPLAQSVIRGLINLRGQIVMVIDLRRSMDLPDRVSDDTA